MTVANSLLKSPPVNIIRQLKENKKTIRCPKRKSNKDNRLNRRQIRGQKLRWDCSIRNWRAGAKVSSYLSAISAFGW